jgi:spore coat protein A, manganese oxidase
MTWARRDIVRLAGASLMAPWAGCVRPRPEAKLLPSSIPLPKPFDATLPVPPVAMPVRRDSAGEEYEITARAADVRILPGLTTRIWGHDGIFPAPTIEARRGRRVSVRLRNQLPAPIVSHLHGGRTAPASDGYPTDLVAPGTERVYVYENNQPAATLWYHDHRMDFTGPQVWRGLAGFYILRDEAEERLGLPSGAREIPLMICDRSFGADGSLEYPSMDAELKVPGIAMEYMGGVLGDVILVNGAPWPRLEVANVRYRFRILNASNARRYELALDPMPAGGAAFVQIGSDGGLLGAPVEHRSLRIAPAERFDVLIDFSKFRVGSSVILADGGRGILRFDIARAERDDSAIRLPETGESREERPAATRDFDFSYDRSRHSWLINGQPFDPSRMDARPRLDSTEIWRLRTDFSHPLHLHLAHFRVLSHSGRPLARDGGWKDTIDLGPGEVATVLARFRGFRGRYVFHCHNLEHEDMAMMGNFEVI